MAKIIMLCGKICSGKSFYANKLKDEFNAVILSCDDLMLGLFDEQLGDRHNEILNKCKTYLYELAQQIIQANVDVILDFGFWKREERKSIIEFFNSKNIEAQIHYVKVDKDTWNAQIEKRNELVKAGKLKCYYVDENMKEIFEKAFEEPSMDENYILALR